MRLTQFAARSDDRQLMSTINQLPDGPCVFLKGSPETVIDRCSGRIAPDGEESSFDPDGAREIAHVLAQEGFRVLAMAFRYTDAETFDGDDPGEAFCGLIQCCPKSSPT